ncbi:MAG: hypothetical protein ACRDN9_06895 [Streptosporangiaceae bacterium]
MRRGARQLATLLAAAALVPACAACASGDTGAAGEGNGGKTTSARTTSEGLLGALTQVQDTKAARAYVEYGDIETLRQLSRGEPTSRFQSVQGIGYSQLAPRADKIADKSGIDPRQADSAVTAGEPPKRVGRLEGSFDVDDINSRLARLGGKQRSVEGGTLWVWHKGGAVDFRNDPFPGLVGLFNVILVEPDAITYGRTVDMVEHMHKRGKDTLATSTRHREMARCLGDVVAAILTAGAGENGGQLYGVGLRAESAQDITEVACVSTKSDDMAARIADQVPNRWNSQMTANGTPWKELLDDPEVETFGGAAHLVRLTAHPPSADSPIGIFPQALYNGDLPRLFRPERS